MVNEGGVIDMIMQNVVNAILFVLKAVTSFILSKQWITLVFWLIVINLLAIFLMKKDKDYAQKEQRRIRESTLLSVALVGGAVGMYFAMYKFKHKTLHKKFTTLVPLCILFHFACIAYWAMNSFII